MKRYVRANDDWLEKERPYMFDGKSMDQYDEDDWAYYLASKWTWMGYDDFYDLLHDLRNLRGDEWVRDYEPDLKKLGCFSEFAKFTGAFEITKYDANIEPEIFDYCDELGGYADYNQKVESVAEEWGMPKDLAEEYVWNWSLRPRLDDEEGD